MVSQVSQFAGRPTVQRIVSLAESHGIAWYVNRQGGLMLRAEYSDSKEGHTVSHYEWVDATDWSKAEMLAWLGY